MAIDIEIIPKPPGKQSLAPNFLLYIMIALLAAAVIIYFTLGNFVDSLNKTLADLKKGIENESTPERLNLEKEILKNKTKIDDYAVIINTHQFNSKFFKLLEDITHPKIYFTKMDLDLKSWKVALTGESDDFVAVGQQVIILQNAEGFNSVNLTKAGLNDKGKVDFSLELFFDPKILK